MIVDSSAVVAILRSEPEQQEFSRLISQAEVVRLSAANFLEASIVLEATTNRERRLVFDGFLHSAGVTIEPVTVEQAHLAREAYRDYGKGSGHPAGLNFGDCFAYALARATGEPLLFKGNDFSHTDVRSALA